MLKRCSTYLTATVENFLSLPKSTCMYQNSKIVSSFAPSARLRFVYQDLLPGSYKKMFS